MREKLLITGCILLLFAVVPMAAPCLADDGTIYGCAGKGIGFLRIVSSPSACTKHETLVLLASKPSEPTGITTAVYGTVYANGDYTGTGFSVGHDAPGLYGITFDPAFPNSQPHCLVTPLTAGNPAYECGPTFGPADQLSVYCVAFALTVDPSTGNIEIVREVNADNAFSFICVQ